MAPFSKVQKIKDTTKKIIEKLNLFQNVTLMNRRFTFLEGTAQKTT